MQTRSSLPRRATWTIASLFILLFLATANAGQRPALARADSLWRADDRPAAFALLDTMVTSARAQADTAAWIAGLTRRSQFLKQDDRPATAEEVVREALDLAAATGDSTLACAPRRWLGVALTAQGRNDEAAAQYRRLASLAMAVGDTTHAAWAAVGLGWDADLRRDHHAADDQYGRAAVLFAASGDGEGELWAQLGQANAWFHLGRYQDAADGWDHVARLAAAEGLARHEAITRNNIAGLQFALGRPDISLQQYERAVAVWDSLGQQWERMPPALNLGSCLVLLGQADRARDLLTRELATCREAGFSDYEARALRKLADLERDQGQFEAAAEHYRQVLAMGDQRPVLERLDARLGLASVHVAGGDHVAALATLAVADSLLAGDLTSQPRVRLDLARAHSLLALGRGPEAAALLDRADTILGDARARFGLELELRRADLHEQQGDPAAARVALERAADIWEQERGLPLDPDWRAERGAAGREAFVRLARHLARDEGPAAAFDRLQRAKARTLREQVLGPEAGADAASALTSVSLDECQTHLLAAGDVFLDAHLSPRGGILFAVTTDSCRVVDLPAHRDLDGRLRAWRDLLGDPASPAAVIADSAASLRADLLAPVAHLLAGADRVIFSPDGALNLVPLADLEPGSDRSWTLVPSASLWRDLRRSGVAADITATPPSLTILLATPGSALELAGSSWQAAHLADTYAGAAIRAGAMDADGLAGLAGRVLHIGAHVRADPGNAWQSAVLLDDGPDGELRAATVAASRLPMPLVVLAGCSSGHGRVLAGEGVQGLAHAFLIAGARAVIATLWPVDDDQSAVFLTRFYEHLAGGNTVGSALAATRAELRADPATAHPFAWAGYVALGDGDATVPLQAVPAAAGWPVAGRFVAPALLAAIMVAWWRRRRAGR